MNKITPHDLLKYCDLHYYNPWGDSKVFNGLTDTVEAIYVGNAFMNELQEKLKSNGLNTRVLAVKYSEYKYVIRYNNFQLYLGEVDKYRSLIKCMIMRFNKETYYRNLPFGVDNIQNFILRAVFMVGFQI